tara:strand:+ start:7248 stop:9395 length:2148 start_codon:yes stop_codon:yes gene_type:complete
MTATPMVGSTFFGLDISQFATRLLSMRRRISKRVLLLEFGPASLLMAEATLTQAGVQLSHVSSFSLPPEALERGVPAEPLKMARLIQAFCAEKKIPAHRVAVVLPPELAFQRLLELPPTLTRDEAREYVLNPANGLQIPFPLTQTDFDLFPVSTPIEPSQVGDKCLYMLTAIPEVLVDPIVEMLQAADLELQLLELGSHSQLRNHAAELVTLGPQQVDLVLELLPECSTLMLVSCSGLLGSERLASIRNLPALDLEAEQLAVAVGSGLSAEDLLFKDENYLPISDLDLRVLVADLKAAFERFYHKLPEVQIRRLILAGVNSSHPLLADLLSEMLGLPIVLSRASSVTGLAGLSMDDLLMQSALGRLTGLSLGLLPIDQLLACSLDIHGVADQESQHQNDVVAIADLLSSSEAQTGLDLFAVEATSAVLITDAQKDIDSVVSVETTIAPVTSVDSRPLATDDVPMVPAEPIDDSLTLSEERDQVEELPTPLLTGLNVDEEPLEIVVEQTPIDPASDQEWPSIVPLTTEPQSDSEVVDVGSSSEGEWPSIHSQTSGGVDDSVPETEWPSIASTQPVQEVFDEVVDAEDNPSEWPSIVLDDALHLSESAAVVENLDAPLLPYEEQVQEDDAIQMTASLSLDQSSVSEKKVLDSLSSSNASEQEIADQDGDLVIPDLPLALEPVVKQDQSKDDEPLSDDLASVDISLELGELRFAEEGD